MKACPCCGRPAPSGLIWALPGAHQVWIDGIWVPVKPIGADILVVLLEAGGGPMSREKLIERVYGPNPPQPNTVHVHIHALRREFRKHLGRPVIETDYGFGFHLEGLPLRRRAAAETDPQERNLPQIEPLARKWA